VPAESVPTQASPPAPASDRLDPQVLRVAVVVVLGSIMSVLDTTIVNIALQTLHVKLHSSIDDVQWVITGYLLSLATVIPLTGWAARRYGAKRVYLTSLVVFTAGSALCGLATSTSMLVAFRVLQGVGGGMIMPVGQMILADAAGPKRMGRAMSITGVPTMLAPILGPTIGGLIIDSTSWRWIFYVNLPIGILATVLAVRMLPSGRQHGEPRKLDIPGLLLMASGMPLFTYGLAEIGMTNGFSSPKVIVPIVVGLVLVAAFVLRSLRVSVPLLDMQLFRRSTYASASMAVFCLGGALFGAMVLLPLYFQNLRGDSVVDTGLLLGPQGLGMALVMPISGRLTDRVGGGPLAVWGVILTTLASVPFGLIGAHTSIVWLLIVQLFRGVGIGFGFMPAFIAAFAALERSELADAAPQLNVIMRVGGSIGTALLAVVLQQSLNHLGSHASDGAMAGAYGRAFWWSVGLSAAAVIPCIVLWRAERAVKRRQAAADDSAPPAGPEALPAEALAEAMA
jgi:EmrB/QacA subfamily drug resistance transporter